MKQIRTYIAFWAFLFLVPWSALGQRGLEADVRLFNYQTPDAEQFAELYIGILTSSLQSSHSEEGVGVDVTVIVKKNGEITKADKYYLTGAAGMAKDFYHIQRLSLSPGAYDFEVELVDIVDSTNRTSRLLHSKIKEPSDQISISTLQLLGNVTPAEESNPNAKSGFLMEPLKYQFLNSNYDRFRAYFEIYNTDSLVSGKFLVRYDLIHEGPIAADTVLTRYKRRYSTTVDPVLIQEVTDTSWPSGKYQLVVHVLNFNQEVLCSGNTQFVFSNPRATKKQMIEEDDLDKSFVGKLNNEELNYALKALAPKVNAQDVGRLNEMISAGSRESRMAFLYRFWEFYTPIDPESGYLNYMNVVKAVDNMYYDGLGHGFETDRGYIYLKYGQPDDLISIEDESSAPPYEIWTYNDFPATKQNNVKFVFYNPASTAYELLHSNARGELNDPRWLIKLYRNSPEDVIGNQIDSRQVSDNWNRRAAEYFNE